MNFTGQVSLDVGDYKWDEDYVSQINDNVLFHFILLHKTFHQVNLSYWDIQKKS
jgi:hypothetical protein